MVQGELFLFDAEGFFAETVYPVRLALEGGPLGPLEQLFARHDLEQRGASLDEVRAELGRFDRAVCTAYKETGPAVLHWPDCPAERCPAAATCPYLRLGGESGASARPEENYLGGSALAIALELVLDRYVEREPAFPVGRLVDDMRAWLQVRAFPGSPAGQVLGLMWRLIHRGFVVGRADPFGYSGFLMPAEARDLGREARELPVGAMAPDKVKRAAAGLHAAGEAAAARARGLVHGLF